MNVHHATNADKIEANSPISIYQRQSTSFPGLFPHPPSSKGKALGTRLKDNISQHEALVNKKK